MVYTHIHVHVPIRIHMHGAFGLRFIQLQHEVKTFTVTVCQAFIMNSDERGSQTSQKKCRAAESSEDREARLAKCCVADIQYPSDARYNAFACSTRAACVRHACDLHGTRVRLGCDTREIWVRHACAIKTRVIMHIHGRHISPAQRASTGMDQNEREIDGELARTTG